MLQEMQRFGRHNAHDDEGEEQRWQGRDIGAERHGGGSILGGI